MTYHNLEVDITRPTLRAQNEEEFTQIAEGKADKAFVG